jgi:tricarballylate dehydrogenase
MEPAADHDFDVVVVGCGVAGLSAAVAAAGTGARVAVLERSTYDERGGGTRYTTAAIRMQSEDAVSDDFQSRFLDNCGYHVQPDFAASTVLDYENWSPLVRSLSFTDPELISFLADAAPPTIAWLKALGVKFGGIGFYGLTPRTSPRIAIVGGGLHLIEVMTAHAEKIGVQFSFETTAQSLIQSESGAVCGLRAGVKGVGATSFRSRAVILACGGFQGNPEMVVRYIGPKGRYLRPVSRGSYYNKGEGIEMALRIGAAPAGDFAEYHAEPIDPRSSATEPIVMAYPYGILINAQGRRFVDEAPGPIDANYERTTRIIAEQNMGLAFCILDDKINAIENWRRTVRSDEPPETTPDLKVLGPKLGFDGYVAQRTIEEYNAACPASGDFNPRMLDGLATVGLSPAKSNYAVPLDTPPYHVYPIISSNTFTFGGLKVNADSQVVNNDGDPLPGLYAAGETAGMYYGDYPGATSVLRGAVFGKRAGEHAGKQAVEK